MKLIILTLLIHLLPSIATAEDYPDGNKLLNECRESLRHMNTSILTHQQSKMAGSCVRKISNMDDTLRLLVSENYCRPEMSFFKLTMSVVNHLNKTPEELHKSDGSLIVNALIKTYPCKKQR